MQSGEKEGIVKYKLIFTGIVFAIYMVGRLIPLYGVDTLAYAEEVIGAEELLMQTIGGDTYHYSVFALGISPYIIAMLCVQIALMCRNSDSRAKVSPRKVNCITFVGVLGLSMLQAWIRINELEFRFEGEMLLAAKLVAFLELVAGALLIVWLSDMNKKYGIGGQTMLILTNILSGILSTLDGHSGQELVLPIAVAAAVSGIILFMENTEKRIPVQRISIHNIYADKNYLAIKHNPAGVMPVMFSTAAFMLPQLLAAGLGLLFPENEGLIWWHDNLVLTRPLGIAVYILLIYLLAIGFSVAFINPKDTTEQFLKSGDSIPNLHAGRDTKRYLTRQVLGISAVSATVMAVCLGMPLILQLAGIFDSNLAMFPSSAMMFTGMCCNFCREFAAVRRYDAYQGFIFT